MTLTDTTRGATLPPGPGLVAGLRERARETWDARELLLEFARRDVRVRYRQAVLGVAWALLIPGLTVLAGLVLRSVVRGTAPAGGLSGAAGTIPAAVLAGIALKGVAWAFFAGAVGGGTTSLAGNASLIARVYFPREVVPLATTLAQAVDLATGLVSVALLLALLGVGVGPTALWAPLLLLLLVALAGALGAVLACANLFLRDVRHVVQVLLTFGVFFAPVFVDVEQFGARGARLAMLNPVAPLLEGLRLAVVGRHDLLHPLVTAAGVVVWDPLYLAWSLVWVTGLVLLASALYARLGSVFAEYL